MVARYASCVTNYCALVHCNLKFHVEFEISVTGDLHEPTNWNAKDRSRVTFHCWISHRRRVARAGRNAPLASTVESSSVVGRPRQSAITRTRVTVNTELL